MPHLFSQRRHKHTNAAIAALAPTGESSETAGLAYENLAVFASEAVQPESKRNGARLRQAARNLAEWAKSLGLLVRFCRVSRKFSS
jgi:hypothetical protein